VARSVTKVLTDAELRIMRVLWDRGEATIGDVVDTLRPPSARATVQTILRILERKRYVRHRADGRSFVYRPIVERWVASERALQHFLGNFVPDASRAMVMRLINAGDLEQERLDQIQALLAEDDDA
jgi:predicted transcriptional regulator